MNTKRLKNFKFPEKYIIWKVLNEQSGTRLVLELRDGEEREVVFACIDLTTMELIWDDLAFEEDWWVSVSEVVAGAAYFFQYSDNQVPEPDGVISFDIAQKEISWYMPDYQLEKAFKNYLKVFKFNGGEKEIVWINALTGEILQASPGKIEAVENHGQQPALPTRYLEGTGHFDTVSNFIRVKTNDSPTKLIDYVEHNGYILMSYYHKNVKSFENKLIIFDVKGNFIWEDVIDLEVNGMGLESFFIWNDSLIWVKNKRELCLLSLKH